MGMLSLVVLVLGLGSWSLLTSIAGAVVATGQVEVASKQQVVQHPDGGVVDYIHVTDGDLVDAGELLISLDGMFLRSELAIVENQFFEILARRSRLEAERDSLSEITFSQTLVKRAETDPTALTSLEGQVGLFHARATNIRQRKEQLEERKAQIASQIDGIDAQIEALSAQLELIEEELSTQQTLLDRELTLVARVLALRRQLSSFQGELGALRAARAEALGKITETNLDSLSLQTVRQEEAATELRELGPREIELAEQRRTLAERIARLEIRAPVSGIVHGLQVTTPRSVLLSAEPVGYIVPQDQPLTITALIDPTDISNVFAGQATSLRFTAFSARTTPEVDGYVTVVSADAFSDTQSGNSFYQARIALREGQMDRLNGQTLLPGMPVEVMLMTELRSPMSYLLKPLSDYFTKAFREN